MSPREREPAEARRREARPRAAGRGAARGARAARGRQAAGQRGLALRAMSRRSRSSPRTPTPGCGGSPPISSSGELAPTRRRVCVAFAAPIVPADVDALARRSRGVPRGARRRHRSAEPRRGHAYGRDHRRHGHGAPTHRAVGLTPAVAKAAAGALEYLPVAFVSGIPGVLERAARAHVWCVGLDADGDTSVFDLPVADQPLVLVLGAEGRGLSRLARVAVRRGRVDPDARAHRVAQRERGRRRRVTEIARHTPKRRDVLCREHRVAEGRRSRLLDSVTIVRNAGLAQSAEHFTCKEDVVGSIPTPGSNVCAGERRARGACVWRLTRFMAQPWHARWCFSLVRRCAASLYRSVHQSVWSAALVCGALTSLTTKRLATNTPDRTFSSFRSATSCSRRANPSFSSQDRRGSHADRRACGERADEVQDEQRAEDEDHRRER